MPARLLPYGDRAVLVEVDDLHQALAIHGALQELFRAAPQRFLPPLDVVAGARTVLLVAESPRALPALRSQVHQWLTTVVDEQLTSTARPQSPPADHIVEVPVHYVGDDLADVAELTGLSVSEVVAAHTGTPWRVGFAGFAPGFAYLVEGDPRLRVPRRTVPRPRVPAGAVGLADEFSGVYPRPSPGGWQLLGHTDLALWDLEREPPALLRPGRWVRFTDADRAS